MKKATTGWGRLAAVLTALALVAAACGGALAGDESASLPRNDNPADTPADASTCAPGEPDCNDTLVIGGNEPQDLPDGATDPNVVNGAEPVSSDGMPVDGGLPVSAALTTDAAGVIAVQGFLLDDGTGARLCEALAESYPPQCGGASIPVTGYEEVITTPLSSAQGVTWTDASISLVGDVIDGTLVVSPTTSG